MHQDIKQYLVITANYWSFTLTDGALRMLVVLYFHQLGYDALGIAMLFLFYEFFGVLTNLFGGYLGARLGLNKTMNIGLFLQIVALGMLTLPDEYLSILWVMAAQALSGIAKDLNKMSAKSAIKLLVPKDAQSQLFKWVAILTGSKNTLKGVGFFLGGLLLALFGFQTAILLMAVFLVVTFLSSLILLKRDLGKKKNKPKFSEMFSKSGNVNRLSAARLFLFAARDVWFVIALPVYLANEFQWSSSFVGGFLALWVIGYGFVQAGTPNLLKLTKGAVETKALGAERKAQFWAACLAFIPGLMFVAYLMQLPSLITVMVGLLVFAIVFAINSALHSYLIVQYADADGVSMDVGFYYMSNAMGRLLGTILSGAIFHFYGFEACLLVSAILVLLAYVVTIKLVKFEQNAF